MTAKVLKEVIGLTENITVYNNEKTENKKLKARIDTGAESNSIDSKLAAALNLGPIIKTTVVKSANGQSLRPVINCTIRLGDKDITGKFTIADRSRMRYKVLIGRNILSKSGFLIDPKIR